VKFTTRLAVLLGLFLVMFSMLGIRLWFIQVAEGAQAAVLASDQSWVIQSTPAPRGEIKDRRGIPLAASAGGIADRACGGCRPPFGHI